MNSQLAHDDCRRIPEFGHVNAADGREPVTKFSAVNAIEVGYDVTYDAACL